MLSLRDGRISKMKRKRRSFLASLGGLMWENISEMRLKEEKWNHTARRRLNLPFLALAIDIRSKLAVGLLEIPRYLSSFGGLRNNE